MVLQYMSQMLHRREGDMLARHHNTKTTIPPSKSPPPTLPKDGGAFLHGTGSDGERPGYASAQEEVMMDAATRADLLEIAERSPHRHERIAARVALHDDAAQQHERLQQNVTTTPGMTYLRQRAERERQQAFDALKAERTTPSSSREQSVLKCSTPGGVFTVRT